jgi:hypothetical protein
MRAKIEWVRPEEGGRSSPPSGSGSPPYATLVKLGGSNEPWPPSEAWSLVVEKVEASNPFTWEAEVKFLADGAPAELLTSGRTFELYEGHKRVAAGTLR